MKIDLKQKWLAALRSGDYKQNMGALYRQDMGYCCLGVLCDISNLGAWDTYITHAELREGDCNHPIYKTHDGERLSYLLENKSLKDVGMTDRQQMHLAELNDDGKSFAEIADWIDFNIPEE